MLKHILLNLAPPWLGPHLIHSLTAGSDFALQKLDRMLLNLLAVKYGLGSCRIRSSTKPPKPNEGVVIKVAGQHRVVLSPLAFRVVSSTLVSCCFLIIPVEFIIAVNDISGVNNVFQAGQLLALVASIGVCWSLLTGSLTDKRTKNIEEFSKWLPYENP